MKNQELSKLLSKLPKGAEVIKEGKLLALKGGKGVDEPVEGFNLGCDESCK